MILVIAIVIVWIVSGVLLLGLVLGHSRRVFENIDYDIYQSNIAFACVMSLFGPASLLIGFLCLGRGKYGLCYSRPVDPDKLREIEDALDGIIRPPKNDKIRK
jgi:hypothetical protein